jgi:energy-coupling factor transporter ATP-binding protein EcfA2
MNFDTETRIIFCYGPAASGKTTFAQNLARLAKNPIDLGNENQLTLRMIAPCDLVILDGVRVSEASFNFMLNHPTPKTYVICSTEPNEFLPTEDDRVTVREFSRQ